MNPVSKSLELASELISRASVTPDDAGCQDLIGEKLQRLGFELERMDHARVSNLWARRGRGPPLFCFAGHTDVVPAGPTSEWITDPFIPHTRERMLYGRGAADMKGALAAMITATEQFLADHPTHAGSIAFLLTSDEEGPAVDGTRHVVETLLKRGDQITWCLIGEPSSTVLLGDCVRIGRRGSLNGRLKIQGTQGHVAYDAIADNPVHRFAPALIELTTTEWDLGSKDFPATRFQVSNIRAGTGAPNVIPGELHVDFNLRYSPAVRQEDLRTQVVRLLERHGLKYTIDWELVGEPFLTRGGALIEATRVSVEEIVERKPELSTGGGTSDGRFIAPTGAEVVELGLVNETIHKVNECARISDLDTLSRIYQRILERLLLR